MSETTSTASTKGYDVVAYKALVHAIWRLDRDIREKAEVMTPETANYPLMRSLDRQRTALANVALGIKHAKH